MLCGKFEWCAIAVLIAILGSMASAENVIVRLVPSSNEVALGQTVTVSAYADIPSPVVGWGLDMTWDNGTTIVGSPAIGSAWVQAPSGDGDKLAAFAFPSAISGNNVLLFSSVFSANQIGMINFRVSATAGDLTEGFPLQGSGFASFSATTASVNVPEPGTMVLLGVGGVMLRKKVKGRRQN